MLKALHHGCAHSNNEFKIKSNITSFLKVILNDNSKRINNCNFYWKFPYGTVEILYLQFNKNIYL